MRCLALFMFRDTPAVAFGIWGFSKHMKKTKKAVSEIATEIHPGMV